MNKSGQKKIPAKVGLALGSGAARGWAHIGVIEALLESGHEITCVAGTSMGALIGAVYASDKLAVFADVARRLDLQQVLYHFFEVSFPRYGLLDGTKIEEFVRGHVRTSDIESLPIPFCAVAADLSTGEEVYINTGDIIEAVRASIATPGILTPARRKGRILVDGGLVNPVPVNAARELGADFVIAVDVSRFDARRNTEGGDQEDRKTEPVIPKPVVHGDIAGRIIAKLRDGIDKLDKSARAYKRQWKKNGDLPNIFDVLGNAIRIMESRVAESRLKIEPPDMLVRPKVGHLGFMDFHHAAEAIEEGRLAMQERL